MPAPELTMEDTAPAAKPGGQVRVSVRVANRGKRVEGYRLDVVGSGVTDWAEVVPPGLDVFPGDEATAVVVISPPAGQAAPSGRWPFGIRARSSLDQDSVVAEGELEVGAVFGVQSKLVPVTSSGRWRGRHVVHLANWGNSTLTLRLTASDPDAALGFLVRPAEVQLPVGAQTTSVLQVRGRRPFLRGTPVRVPFTVVGEPAGGASPAAPGTAPDPAGRPVLDGALLQKPILSRGVVTLGVIALLLAAGAVVWGVTRPAAVGSAGYVDTVPPDQPKNLQAVATGPSTVNLTWSPQARVRQWEIRSLQGKNGSVFQVGPAEAAQTSSTVQGLPATKESCFQIRALGFGVDGPLSEAVCATTPAAPPSANPSPSVATLPPVVEPTQPAPALSSSAGAPGPVLPISPTPELSTTATATATESTPTSGGQPAPLAGAWTAVAIAFAGSDPNNPVLQKFVTDLQAAKVAPELIYSADYPNLKPADLVTGPSYLVIVGRYLSEPEAEAACQATIRPVTGYCRAAQPQAS